MRKTRIMIQLAEPELELLDIACKAYGRSRPYIIERALPFALSHGLDLSAGQAEELAEFMRRRGQGEAVQAEAAAAEVQR